MILLINASSKLPTDANDFEHAKKNLPERNPLLAEKTETTLVYRFTSGQIKYTDRQKVCITGCQISNAFHDQ